jgi:hypothetical protein
MADNYEQCTVEPCLPATAVSEFERKLLCEYGFTYELYEDNGQAMIYFFAEDGLITEVEDFDPAIVLKHAQLGDATAKVLEAFATGSDDSPIDSLDKAINKQFPWETLLQNILKKTECGGIKAIRVMGAFSCGKLRPGEFGGWVWRITKDTIQHDDTILAYNRMEEEVEFHKSLAIVLNLAESNRLDLIHDPERDTDEAIVEQCTLQDNALEGVKQYLFDNYIPGDEGGSPWVIVKS